MPQIINDAPGIGALLGQGLGQGLNAGLQQLAQLKIQNLLNQKRQRETAKGLAALGFSPEEAQQISVLPQELQGLVLKNYLGAAENAGMLQGLEALRGEQVPTQQALFGQAQQPQYQAQEEITPELIAATQIPKKGLGIGTEDIAASLLNKKQQGTREDNVAKKIAANKQEAIIKESPAKKQLSDLLRSPRTTPEQKLKLETLRQQRELAEKRLSSKEQENVDKETAPVYKEIQSHYKAAKEGNMRLDRMEQLIKEGKLSNQGVISFVKGLSQIPYIGIDFSALLSADTQEFEKLSNDFIKNAKDYFGNRLTDQDLKAFLKTVPTITQSDEGKMRVIKNLRLFNEAAVIKKKASDQILKANNYRRPRDYEQRVEDLTESALDDLAKRFKG